MADPYFERPVANYVNNFKSKNPYGGGDMGAGTQTGNGAMGGQSRPVVISDNSKFMHPAEQSRDAIIEQAQKAQAEAEALREMRMKIVKGTMRP